MDDTLTLNEAAEFLKIHPATLAEKARAGEIPGAKVGRAWVFIKIDLEEYIRSKYRGGRCRVTLWRFMHVTL